MKKILSIIGICVLIFVLYTVNCYNRSVKYQAFKGMVTLKVVDYEGNIVSNAHVNVGFANALNRNSHSCIGESDENGCFTASGVSDGDIVYTVTKKGYYKTYDRYWFSRGGTERSKWFPWILKFTPWNPTLKIVLKEIRNPIPMYYKSVSREVPITEKNIGFDLFISDWVEPYGKGKTNDFIFAVSGYLNSFNDRESRMNVTFSNGGGIQQNTLDNFSDLPTIHIAPQNGYKTNYFFCKKITNIAEDRINPVSRKNISFVYIIGRLTENMETNFFYGTIKNDFRCDYRSKQAIGTTFEYSLNPIPNDRNLEWSGSNLFESIWSD